MTKKLILFIATLSLASACVGNATKSTRYYIIDPIQFNDAPLTQKKDLSIEVVDLHMPQYLERFHIASRMGANQLKFSDSHQWAENLRKNLLRTLSRNLVELLNTVDVATPLGRTAMQPDFRVQIYIEQFEQNVDNTVSLSARWQLSRPGELDHADIYAVLLNSEQQLDEGDYAAMVTVMSDLFGDLSSQIAQSILAQQG